MGGRAAGPERSSSADESDQSADDRQQSGEAHGKVGPGGGGRSSGGFDGNWDALIAELVAAGCEGGSWDRIETEWGLDRYDAMHEHWRLYGPPVHIAVGAYLGFSKPKKKQGDLGDLVRMFAGSGGVING